MWIKLIFSLCRYDHVVMSLCRKCEPGLRNSGHETVHSGIYSDLPSHLNRLEWFPYDRT